MHVRWIRKHVSITYLPISKVVMILVIWIFRLKSWLTGLKDAEPSSNWILFFFQHLTFRVAKCVLMLTLPILPLRFLKQHELKMRHCVSRFPLLCHPLHIPWASLVVQMVKSPPSMLVCPWVRKNLWRRKCLPTPAFLSGEFYGWRSLAGYNPWSCKESDMTEQLTLWLSHPTVVKNPPANAGDKGDKNQTNWVTEHANPIPHLLPTKQVLPKTSPLGDRNAKMKTQRDVNS